MANIAIDILRPQCAANSIGTANTAVSTLLQFLIGAYCNLSYPDWPEDYGPKFLKSGYDVYDFVVVGGGTAGSVIAGRLSENPNHRILLIEAGGNPPIESEIPSMSSIMHETEVDFNYETKSNNKSCLGFPSRACRWPRGKMLGGCSSINGMMYIRGNRFDYDNWKNWGNPTWGYDDVFPYFKKSENYQLPNPYKIHGEGGPLAVSRFTDFPEIKDMIIRSAQEAGHAHVDDFREGHYLGYGRLNALLINNQRNSPAKAFLSNKRPNLRVIKNAFVTKINFNRQKHATSVDFVYTDANGKTYNLVAKAHKEIIISAGAVDSPKLLMLSGIGPRKHLESLKIPVICDMAVGRNLQDHALVGVYFTYNGPREDPDDNLFNYLANRQGRLSGTQIVDLSAFHDIKNTTGIYPNMQIMHTWIAQGAFPDIQGPNPKMTEVLREAYKVSGLLAMQMVLLRPNSIGYIELGSKDYRQQPIIYPNYLDDYRDVKLFIDTINTLLKFLETPTFKRENINLLRIDLPECKYYKFGTDKYWECFIRHTSYLLYHPIGTVKMGPDSDPEAVVDFQLRVKGVKGLRVADASIMPKIVSANTMAATIMIGEKAADFIQKTWQ